MSASVAWSKVSTTSPVAGLTTWYAGPVVVVSLMMPLSSAAAAGLSSTKPHPVTQGVRNGSAITHSLAVLGDDLSVVYDGPIARAVHHRSGDGVPREQDQVGEVAGGNTRVPCRRRSVHDGAEDRLEHAATAERGHGQAPLDQVVVPAPG